MIRKIIKIDIVPFEKKYFSQLVDFVKPMWSFSTWEDSFRKIYTELILQNSFFENNLTFQIALPKDKLCSAMFFQNKSDKNNISKWIDENTKNLSKEKKQSINLCAEYLSYMDSKVHTLMNDDDIKLSLFVSCQKGYGSLIFNELINRLKNQNYKNVYLWTDCECNWQWYIKNNFTLIEEAIYPKFNEENKLFKTYIFKKQIG